MTRLTALRLAFGLLTAVPMGRIPEPSRRRAAVAMLLAPVTTLPMALVLCAGHLVAAPAPALVLLVAVVSLAAEALVTRAMHLDGLADTADGLSAGYDAPSSLRAMKASDIGPSGVAAVVLVLLLQAAALGVLLPSTAGTALAVLAWVWSRHALAWACRRGVPAAQEEGLGAMVAGTVGGVPLALALGGCALVTAVTGWAAGVPAWHLLVVPATALLATGAIIHRARQRLGGITGDVLGAVVETSLAAGLAAAAAVTAWPAG
jgi:adenosylcobinamide-GDP ribazoletransferase